MYLWYFHNFFKSKLFPCLRPRIPESLTQNTKQSARLWRGLSHGPLPQPLCGARAGSDARLLCSRLVSCDSSKMAALERRAASAAESKEDFEIIDKNQVPNAAELKSEEAEKAEEARWSAPILSLARKASENLALGYGSALRSASLAGLIPRAAGTDSTARTSTALLLCKLLYGAKISWLPLSAVD